MKRSANTLCWAILSLLLALTSSPVLGLEHSDLVDEVARDFSSLSGLVIMRSGQEILIDLDATKGLVNGDLLAVITPGEAIVHPESGTVLGHLNAVKAVLQVTQVGTGYSYARILGDASGVERGDTVQRYEKIAALLWDYRRHGNDGEVFFTAMKEALPRLNWQGYQMSQQERPQSPALLQEGDAQLYFILEAGTLNVRGPDFELIHSYTLPAPEYAQPAAQHVARQPVEVRNGAWAAPAYAAPIVDGVDVAYQPGLNGEVSSITLGDFNGDHQNELAVAFANTLELSHWHNGEYQQQQVFELGAGAKILHLDAIDLDQDGCDELYVTAVRSGRLVSRMLTLVDGTMVMERRASPWYLRVVELPEEGNVLLAQRMGEKERDFDGPTFRVVMKDGQLEQGAAVDLPWALNLYGFAPFKSEQGQTLYATLSLNDTLQVMNAHGQVVWESLERFGGSESYFDTFAGGRDDQSRRVYIKARVELNRQGEVLVTANKGAETSTWQKKFVQGTIVALRWDGTALRENWRVQSQGGYLADFCVVNSQHGQADQVLGAMRVTSGDFWGKNDAFSKLVSFEIE
jgi:hypothetical protein